MIEITCQLSLKASLLKGTFQIAVLGSDLLQSLNSFFIMKKF